MFPNLQTILSILCHILVDFLRTATDLSSLPIINIALKWGMRLKATPPTKMFGYVSPPFSPLTFLIVSCADFLCVRVAVFLQCMYERERSESPSGEGI